jgi:serine/threonine protein phosphatase 1
MDKINKTFVIGDIHGGYKALLQCIERSSFDLENDLLISLGDLVDGWPESKEVFDYLMKLKNFILILGNHDEWFYQWTKTGATPFIWTQQGGEETLKSFSNVEDLEKYKSFLDKSVYYYKDEKNRVFVHGGFPYYSKIEDVDKSVLVWDRDLIQYAFNNTLDKYTNYNKVFIGHTTTTWFRTLEPMNLGEIWNIDTGGGWEGRLTIMDVDSEQWWQSDKVSLLYPECKGRK